MSLKVALLVLAALLVLLPWALWRIQALRRVAPLAVIQIMAGIALGPSLFGRVAPEWHAAVFSPPVLAASPLKALGVNSNLILGASLLPHAAHVQALLLGA